MTGRVWGVGVALALVGHMALAQAPAKLQAVGLESQYADVLAQIGGPYVQVRAIQTDPNTDPHEFEVTPSVARALRAADLVVENGLGYDAWANGLLAGGQARVVSAQALLGLPNSAPNPHLWYRTDTMPAVAQAAEAFFAARDPAHAAQYRANLAAFEASLAPWRQALAAIRRSYAGADVAVSEPVADDLLQAAGLHVATPFTLELAVMNDTDPAPQDVAAELALLKGRRVRLFVYNEQVTDPQTQSFLAAARQSGVAVLPVYELMPAAQKHYQDWMLSTTNDLAKALAAKSP